MRNEGLVRFLNLRKSTQDFSELNWFTKQPAVIIYSDQWLVLHKSHYLHQNIIICKVPSVPHFIGQFENDRFDVPLTATSKHCKHRLFFFFFNWHEFSFSLEA